ncbi:MAG: alcohol dehydrogenase [Synergistaceae bacterium]|jgi:ribosomal protein S27AE|nr:alcohol dehydrogenase [Synergistaceae bacterium]
MVIAECEICGETKVLAGTPDRDGVTRLNWTCSRCGTGQVLQVKISGEQGAGDLHSVLGNLMQWRRKDGGEGGIVPGRKDIRGL